jgi:hypothetical protein
MNRRAPEVAAGDGLGQGEEGVGLTIYCAHYARQLQFKGSKAIANLHEVQAWVHFVVPGHGTAQAEAWGAVA